MRALSAATQTASGPVSSSPSRLATGRAEEYHPVPLPHASVARDQADQLAYWSLITMLLTFSHHDSYSYHDAAEDKAIEPNRDRLLCRVTSDAVVVSYSACGQGWANFPNEVIRLVERRSHAPTISRILAMVLNR